MATERVPNVEQELKPLAASATPVAAAGAAGPARATGAVAKDLGQRLDGS